jgi:hypothetical protein
LVWCFGERGSKKNQKYTSWRALRNPLCSLREKLSRKVRKENKRKER